MNLTKKYLQHGGILLLALLAKGSLAADLNLPNLPLEISTAVKPNVLLILDNSTSMEWTFDSDDASIVYGNDSSANSADWSRWKVAKQVTADLVNRYADSKTNMGLMIYRQYDDTGNPYAKGWLRVPCSGTSGSTIVSTLGAIALSSGTPLEGTFITAKDYFQGTLTSAIEGGSTPAPQVPNQGCAPNYTVLITDGGPSQRPGQWSGRDPIYPDDRNYTLVTATNLYNATTQKVPVYVVGIGNTGTGYYATEARNTMNAIAQVGNTSAALMTSNMSTLAASLDSVLGTVLSAAAQNGSISGAASNNLSVMSNSHIYQTYFSNSNSWFGRVVSRPLDPTDSNNDGSLVGDIDSCLGATETGTCTALPAHTARKIYTNRGNTGILFKWPADPAAPAATELTTAQSTALGNADILNYLRGDASKEIRNGGTYRNRPYGAFGDITHASPVYVGVPHAGYPDSIEPSSAYSTFRSGKMTRQGMLYVGANDGMLHALSVGTDGKLSQEEWAYIPSALISKLPALASPNYGHYFYIDATPAVGDAYIGGSWKTVLVGGLNGGGRSIYALDVTTPAGADTNASAAARVLWEFTPANGGPVGYSYSPPIIGKMHNGKWAAIFGNGYNSGSGPMVYIVDLADGSLIKELATTSPTCGDSSLSNGMGPINAVDVDGDFVVDYIYGGDLQGSVWKFDVTNTSTTAWGMAYSNRFYTAKDANGNVQPITTRPLVTLHPTQSTGLMVYFGTGKYLESTDTASAGVQTQTFYGVWDNGAAVDCGRSGLQAQTINYEFSSDGNTWRQVSDNAVNWGTQKGWYLDLYNMNGGTGTAPATNNTGERVIADPVFKGGKLLFPTFAPTGGTGCGGGGTSYLMAINPSTGGRLPYSAFDVNNDKVFNSTDFRTGSGGSTGGVPVSGMSVSSIASSIMTINASRTSQIGVSLQSNGSVTAKAIRLGSGVGRIWWGEALRPPTQQIQEGGGGG